MSIVARRLSPRSLAVEREDIAHIAEEAARRVVESHGIRHESGESAIQALAWELGEGVLTYENGLAALVESALTVAAERTVDCSPK